MKMGERSLYQRALTEGLWLYHTKRKEWYTPEEYIQLVESEPIPLDYIEARDPLQALVFADTKIAEQRAKLEDMIKRRNTFEYRVFEAVLQKK